MNKAQRWLAEKLLGIKLNEKAASNTSLAGSWVISAGTLTPLADNKTTYVNDGYGNDIVYSIINLILDKVRIVPWNLYRVKDESSLKLYQGLISRKDLSGKDFKKAMELHSKALEVMTSFNMQEGKLNELLKWPNEEETYSDYFANGCAYKLVTGDKFKRADILEAGANKGVPQSLYVLPSQAITILGLINKFPAKATGYQLTVLNQSFTKEEVLHEKYWNPHFSATGQQLYGMSPLKAALQRVNRNNSAQEASSAKFQNNGLEAIVYVDDDRLTGSQASAQATAIKNALIHEYSGPANYGKITTSGYKMGVANLGLSPVELGIIDSEKWDALMFCNIYGVPPELLGLTQKTYNNALEAEKALTTRSAIPLINSDEKSTNRKLQTDWGFKGKNIYVGADLSVYTELEQNKKDIIEWTNGLIAITPNQQLEAVGLPQRKEKEMDELWVKTGERKPLRDYQENETDQILNDGSGEEDTD